MLLSFIFLSFPAYETLTRDSLTTIYLSSDLSIVLGEAQNPIYDFGPLPLQVLFMGSVALFSTIYESYYTIQLAFNLLLFSFFFFLF